jgi:L-fuconolactonase
LTGRRPRVLDAHHHVWQLAARPQAWLWEDADLEPLRRDFALADLVADMQRADAAEVVGTVLVQTGPDAGETEELLSLAAAEPLVVGVVGWTDLTRPDLADRLAQLRAKPGGQLLCALRHPVQDEPDPSWLLRPDVVRGLTVVASAELAFDLLVRPPQLAAAAEVVHQVPGLRFVLDHAGKPPITDRQLEPWASALRRMATSDLVSVKLSGLVSEADPRTWTVDQLQPYVDTVLEAFGAERVMFGSDWPVCRVATSWAGWLEVAQQLVSRLAESERACVFERTARRIYRLDRHGGGRAGVGSQLGAVLRSSAPRDR